MGRGLPKKYAKMGFKKGWAAYKRTKNRGTSSKGTSKKRSVRRTAKRKRKGSRRSSNKWGVVGTVFKLGLGAFIGNWLGGQLAKRIDPEGTNPLYRAGGALAGAIVLKKILGRSGIGAAVGTGAAAMLAGHAALDFQAYMKARSANGG